MYDYTFICFLLGNDFIPNVACLKIKSGAVDIICELYKETYNEVGNTLIAIDTVDSADTSNSKYRINYTFLISLLNKLSAREDKLMVDVTKEFYETAPAFKHFNTKLEKFTYELDNGPQYNKFPFVIDPIEDTSWRSSYYHHLFGSHKMDMINKIINQTFSPLRADFQRARPFQTMVHTKRTKNQGFKNN
jgi:5'-3' exoribonuclease 2